MIQIHISSIFDRYPSFGSVLGRFGHFWKKRAKGHVSLLPGLVHLVVLAVHNAIHPVNLKTDLVEVEDKFVAISDPKTPQRIHFL